jgi:hypothetical protein
MTFHQRASVLVTAAILALAPTFGAQAAEGTGAPAPLLAQAATPAPAPTTPPAAIPADEKATAPAAKTPGAAEAPAASAEKPARTVDRPVRAAGKPRAAARPIVRPVRYVRRDVYRVASRYEPPPVVRGCGFWCGPLLIIGIGF